MPAVDLLLIDIAIIVLAARLAGTILARLGQPPVIGEILAGILLGPTLLGHVAGHRLFPATVLPPLTALADLGLVLFMFTVGMELDQALVRSEGRAAGGIAASATATPFVLGCALAAALADQHAHGRHLAFVLFLGIAVAATAFPVLARILTDRGMQHSRLGGLALSSAALIDAIAWAMLAIVVAIASAADGSSWRLALLPGYLLIMGGVVRPLLKRLATAAERTGKLTTGMVSYLLIGVLISAAATQWMQIHFIFGAFLFGALMPRSGDVVRQVPERILQLATVLLPIYFVITGLTVNLSTLPVSSVGILTAILAVSIGGKLTGAYAGARLTGTPPRDSAVLAALINTRGLTEIVILTVGLQEHILDTEMYSLMIVMALVTTAMTGPLLSLITRRDRGAEQAEDTGQAAVGAARSI